MLGVEAWKPTAGTSIKQSINSANLLLRACYVARGGLDVGDGMGNKTRLAFAFMGSSSLDSIK